MNKFNKNQTKTYVRKNLTKKTKTEMAEYLHVTERTIRNHIKVIVREDMKDINKENVIHRAITRLDELRVECVKLSQKEGVQDSVLLGAINTEMKILSEHIKVLQEADLIDKVAEKHEVDYRDRTLEQILKDRKQDDRH